MSLVTVASYRDPIDAELAKAKLEAADIPAFVLDQYVVGVQWLYSRAIGGVKVTVDAEHAAAAREVLREDRSGDLAPLADERTLEADACPACGSSELRRSRLQRNAAALSLATGLPFIAWRRRRWICAACGHAWRSDPRAAAPMPAETLAAEEQVHERRAYPMIPAMLAVMAGLLVFYYVECGLHRAHE